MCKQSVTEAETFKNRSVFKSKSNKEISQITTMNNKSSNNTCKEHSNYETTPKLG